MRCDRDQVGDDFIERSRRPRWLGKDDLLAMLKGRQADAGLRSDLRALAPDTTDDLPLR